MGYRWFILAMLLSTQSQGKDLLDHITIQVNGDITKVEPGKALKVFEGDQVKIVAAKLASGKQPEFVNLVGFRRPGGDNPFDDTGKLVLVGDELNRQWAIRRQYLRYRINVRTKSILHGRVFLDVHQPIVRSIRVQVNDKLLDIKPNQTLRIKESDQIKLDRVDANFDVQSPGFRYRFKNSDREHDIVMTRYGRKVAVFPIKVY
ncbi:hypothetical protein [Pseudobacteriovorax antillogorgiicola]|uniref:Uncharacterized protein n=1 Tax=Pseudobacteriovorax antillogorgiicola TaxID=1513793 RepID=A0A1Y6B773_9BACT|nr:hypothetical protein [Pseudobacteriovorax antillogorgiicola]TCS59479.1 hypothetical protein EDD56_101393 [Pseudobacteriovorax antillogorgiicola]SME88008.1 hypothetical protein SAMN06296036_10192 [Pseudobacteriovorax antillogorgiicola]